MKTHPSRHSGTGVVHPGWSLPLIPVGWRPLVLVLLLTCGCNTGPAAPMLSDSPVYRNASEGFRFVVPEGWIQSASSVLPPGKLGGEIFLARYRLNTPEVGASLQILCLDDEAVPEVQRHHSQPSFRAPGWTVVEESRPTQINGVSAERIVYTADLDGKSMTKLVVAYRRHGRVYCFVGLYWSTDDHAGQQLERAVATIRWD